MKNNILSDSAIENVIEKYSDMVYKLAFSMTRTKTDSDDIFQEVFLRYLRKKITFETEEHRKAWLIKVTINCSKNFWASSWIKKIVPLEDNISFETEEQNYIHDMLKKLPKKYKIVIHLFYYEDLSINEISSLLNIKPSTIRTQLTRARRILKKKIQLKEEF